MPRYRKYIILAFSFFVVFMIGTIYERHIGSEIIYSVKKIQTREEHVVVYCDFIEKNPEKYNILLDATELINERIHITTAQFIKTHNLKHGDFDAVIRVTKNGNPRLRIWSSFRIAGIDDLLDEYSLALEVHQQEYFETLNKIHSQ